MDTLQINHALQEWSVFRGTFPINHIPMVYTINPPYALVINTDAFPLEGSHWVAVFCDASGNLEYFDSGAQPPLNHPLFNQSLSYNTKRLQSSCTSVCGEYCILYLLCRLYGIPFINFLDFFTDAKWLQNDAIVYRLVHDNCQILPRERAFPVVSRTCVQLSKKLKL